jgi:hypothetical protein
MQWRADDRLTRTIPSDPITRKGGEEGGPTAPKVSRPDVNDLLKRMKRVDPDQARRYRQRSGE